MKSSLISLAIILFICGIASTDDPGAPKDQPAKFKITSRKKNDAVEVQVNMDKAVFVVKSSSGISQAVIERLEESWPRVVVLRLQTAR